MEKSELMPNDYLIAQGLIWRSEIGYAGVVQGDATSVYTGIQTGDEEVVILQRAYSSTQSALTVELYKASWSDGTDARTINRRIKQGAEPRPAVVKFGVTPGALGAAITGVTLRAASSTGNANLQISGDESRLYLEANTFYVVKYRNDGTAAADIGNSFDYRKALKALWERVLSSA